MHNYSGNFLGMHFVWWIIIIAIILFVLYKSAYQTNENTGKAKETALDILKKRFARGEITKDEFQKAKKMLDES
ncbi:SHOCT domain-containing protein [Lutibacter sp.]